MKKEDPLDIAPNGIHAYGDTGSDRGSQHPSAAEEGVVPQAAFVHGSVRHAEQMHGLDDGGDGLGPLHSCLYCHGLDELGTVVAVALGAVDADGGQKQADIIVMVLGAGLEHGADVGAQLAVGLFGDISLHHHDAGVLEALEGTEMGRFLDEAPSEGVIGVQPSEGVHDLQILGEGDGGVVVGSAGIQLEDAGQDGARLAQHDVDLAGLLLGCLHGGDESGVGHVLSSFSLF